MPLELLTPKALWLLGLLAPLVVLYILKVKRQRMRIASTWLWRQARRDLMARSPFKRLVWQLPLVLQALALILLAMAAAGPATRSEAVAGDHIALVIDTSASMSALDPSTGKRRIDAAKEAASELVRGIAPGSDAMIIDAGRDARIALPADRDTRRMQRVVADLDAREVEGELTPALALAVGRLKQLAGKRRLVVITDRAIDPAIAKGGDIAVDVVRVGTPVANTAIVRVDVRAGDDPTTKREEVQAFLVVANFSAEPREVYVTMRQRNASDTLASRKVLVPAGEKLPVVLSFHPEKGDYGSGLLFDLAPHDAMAVDDVAYGRVPAGRKLPVVLASKAERSPFLLRALVADEHAEVRSGTVAEVLDATSVDHDTFVVVDGACPPSPPGGDLLIVNPPAGDCFGVLVGKSVDAPMITSWDQSDPRLRFLTFDNVLLSKAHLLKTEAQRQALLNSDQGAIAADISTSARHGTLLGFDVGDGNWPYRWSFVVFMRNLMEQARLHRSSGVAGAAAAGEPLRASVPAAVETVTVAGPGIEQRELPARDGLVVIPEVARAGLYSIQWQAPRPGTLWIPVNLASSSESNLLEADVAAGGQAIAAASATTTVESHRDYAWLLALLALAFIVIDVWYLTRRRPTRSAAVRGDEEATA